MLIVSTDPAHSLGDALSMRLSFEPQHVPTLHGSLQAVELNADRALEIWIRKRKPSLRTIAEHGTYLDPEDIEQLLRLSLPGVDEIVGLVELRRLARSGDYDNVIVDTAPTGHTLRLLAVPDTLRRIAAVFDDMQAKHHFLSESLGGAYRSDIGDELIQEIDSEGRELIEMLRDPRSCSFEWVLLPEMLSVEEAKDGIEKLTRERIAISEVIVNRLLPPSKEHCVVCDRRRQAESAAVKVIRSSFPKLPILFVPELEREPRGVAEFRKEGRRLQPAAEWQDVAGVKPERRQPSKVAKEHPASGSFKWLDIIAPPKCRLLMFGGKGGVGKTTCAATAALALAERNPRRKILLLSTDPAHSLGDVLRMRLGDDERPLPGLTSLRVREMDAEQLFNSRRKRYLDSINDLFDSLQGDSRFDVAYDRAVGRDLIDLSPPGLDEIFGILSVSEALLSRGRRAPRYDIVVLDTAPTGHALRLLEMPATSLEWVRTLMSILLKYRKVTGLGSLAAELLGVAKELHQLLELLHDPGKTQLVAVTRAAQLPRMETLDMLKRVSQLKIAVSAVLFNAVTVAQCGRCRRAAAIEQREIAALVTKHRKLLAPSVAPPPQGIDELLVWGRSWKRMGK